MTEIPVERCGFPDFHSAHTWTKRVDGPEPFYGVCPGFFTVSESRIAQLKAIIESWEEEDE